MKNKINIANLLRDCPSGMELECLMYEDVYFDYVDECNIIHCYVQYKTYKTSIEFSQRGTPNNDTKSKCVIFPKGKTTWEGFQRPFKDGDIVAGENRACSYITIFRKLIDNTLFSHHACLISFGTFKIDDFADNSNLRIATEEEKQKLFDAIKANGYKWNEKTKTLDKLITPNKFDVTTLKPFESKVLVRDNADGVWHPCFFGGICNSDNNYPYRIVGGEKWKCCIPYEGNEHLLGKTDDCDNFYKTWE